MRKKLLRAVGALVLLAGLTLTPTLAAELGSQRVGILESNLALSTYTVYDENGYATNYVRLRDVACALQYTTDCFSVSYDGSTRVTTGATYIPDGSELKCPTEMGSAKTYTAVVTVDGVGKRMEAMFITPPGSQDGNFYYKLRDLGQAIGFDVGWSAEQGIYIDTMWK